MAESRPGRVIDGVRPLVAALAFGVGIAAGAHAGGSWPLAGLLAAAAWRWPRGRTVLVLLALVAAGAARGVPAAPVVPAGAMADDRGEDVVTGVVAGPVVRTPRGTGARLDLEDGAAVWLWSAETLVPGERVAATGRLRTPRGLLDPGAPDRAVLVAGRGADWELSARHLEHLGDVATPLDLAWRWAAAVQARGAAAIDDAGGDPGARAALRGIALGDRGDVEPGLDQRWRAIGIYHVLSVSGLHLAVVAGLAFALLRRLVAASPFGGRVRPACWAAPAALVVAVAFTLVTGAQLATLRALVVVALVMIAAMLDRPLRLTDALGVAALAILAWRPVDLRDPSFQLSFVAALTLALAVSGGAPLPAGRIARLLVRVRRGVTTSAWVALTTAPLTAMHFQQVAPGGIVGNLVLTPLVELVALPMALAGLVLPGGRWLVRGATELVGVVDTAAGWLAHVTPVGRVAVASPIAMVVLVALALALAARARRGWLDVVLWVAMCAGWAIARTPPPAGALRVTFVDVGQGDAALVELPDGATWLVDAGGDAAALDPLAAAAPGRAIAAVLAVHGETRVELALLSHPHPDHYLGFSALAQLGVPIDELWSAEQPGAASRAGLASFGDIAAELTARGTRIAQPPLGVAREEAGVTLTVWAPRMPPGSLAALDPVRTVNDNSLVVTIGYRGHTLLFAGDLEAEGEEALVAAQLPAVDVVKVPHHGSPTSSTDVLVAATHPRLAVISCGAGNRFGFPSPAVVARWRAAGADVLRTDTSGAITVIIDDDGTLTASTQVP
jgi:competence protein ComEC